MIVQAKRGCPGQIIAQANGVECHNNHRAATQNAPSRLEVVASRNQAFVGLPMLQGIGT
jgi:hypothetical protein